MMNNNKMIKVTVMVIMVFDKIKMGVYNAIIWKIVLIIIDNTKMLLR